jgi:hypothetical protein
MACYVGNIKLCRTAVFIGMFWLVSSSVYGYVMVGYSYCLVTYAYVLTYSSEALAYSSQNMYHVSSRDVVYN